MAGNRRLAETAPMSRGPFVMAVVASLLASSAALGQGTPARSTAPSPPADPLAEGFRDPPAVARPRMWWHWLGGNITPAGIAADIDWFHRIGIGGVTAFDASLNTPVIVDRRVDYMSPEWKHDFALAADLTDRAGIELGIASSPGWSETGGPWVPPADAMKKLVWSTVDVDGGTRFVGALPAPPGVTGPYGTAGFFDPLAASDTASSSTPTAHGAIKVLAYPITTAAITPVAAVDQTGAAIDVATLTDGREDTSVVIARRTDAPAALTLRLAVPTSVQAATLFVPHAVPPFGAPEFAPVLEAETDHGWQALGTMPLANVPTTIAFAPVMARAFRIRFVANREPPHALAMPAPGAVVAGIFPDAAPAGGIAVASLALFAEPRIDHAEAKAGFTTAPDYYALGDAPPIDGIAADRVVDLTAKLRADGTLDWTPPPGRWRVVRFGWSLLGTTNHPAAPDSTGLEVDKYDGAAVRRYIDRYLVTYGEAMGTRGKGIDALLTDSIEAGNANWTPDLIAQFTRLRGYDPTPWMPTLTGAVIGSRARSDAFLYDYRRTLADLLVSQHYATIARAAHDSGLTMYGEALEDGRPQLGDDLSMRRHTDVPMAAMWAFAKGEAPRATLIGDVLGAASVAHVYGRNLVAAESFTAAFAPWAFAPGDLRRVADLEFALGVNRPVIHTSVMSPPDDKLPGLSLAVFGQYFNRHESWAGLARPWIDYLARSSYLLQQGRHAADVAVFIGEEAPVTQLYADGRMTMQPVRHGFDLIDAGALRDALSVDRGDLVATGGARYRLLYLGGTSQRMTLPTLRRIAALVAAGATVAGRPPVATPSLADDADAFRALVAQLWAGGGETRIGQGRVLDADNADVALDRAGIAPDFDAGTTPSLVFQHRLLDDGTDVYLVVNRGLTPIAVDARFRVAGRSPELWHADSGRAEPVSYRTANGVTTIPLALAPEDSTFVVFHTPTTVSAATIAPTEPRTIATLDQPWRVRFQPGRGAPAETSMPRLTPLDRNTMPGIRYFSGEATYTSRFTLPRGVTAGSPLWLDLGAVGDVAEVRINDSIVATLWHAPYRIDIARAVRPGMNAITVRVANLWVNRLIGDAQPGAAKVTFVAAPTYRADAPLRASGLIGPVTLSVPR